MIIDLENAVFCDVGGVPYKLKEQKNLPPEFNIYGMVIVNGKVFKRVNV